MLEQGKVTQEWSDVHSGVIAEASVVAAGAVQAQGEITVPNNTTPEVLAIASTAMAAVTERPTTFDEHAVVVRHRAVDRTGGLEPGEPGSDAYISGEGSASDLPHAGGGAPPTDVPPSRGMEAGGDQPEPTLEPGTVMGGEADVALDEGAAEVSEDGEYTSGDPSRAYVRAGRFVVGRAGGEFPDLSLEGRSEGCRIITMTNSVQEGALIHVDVTDMGTTTGEAAIRAIINHVPSLGHPETAAKIFGDVETSPLGQAAADWNDRLANYLQQQGIADVEVITAGRGKDVILQVSTGEVQAKDLTGQVIYPPRTHDSE